MVVASLEIVAGLSDASFRAGAAGGRVVSAELLASVLLSWLGAPDIRWEVAPGFGASGDEVPDEAEDEVDATLRLGAWRARGRLRRRPGDAVPAWDERVRVALGRALAAAGEGDIRYVGYKLFLRSLLAECDSPGEWMEFVRRFHLRPDEEFLADGTPDAQGCLQALHRCGQVTGPDEPAGGRVRVAGALEPALRAEATRQAVRGGCALVGPPHLVMAMCAVDYAMRRIGARWSEPVAGVNGGARALAAAGVGYPELKDFAMDLEVEPADPPRGDRTWRPDRESPPFSAGLLQVSLDAARLAADLGHRAVGTSHLLYVIASDAANPAARMLGASGVDPATLAVRLGQELAP
ncbi:Clp protease N-terminal domain-containing protein [Dactylosporangium sp. CA-139066]|uniref:Clp protease N-terminal domain-containing protein n=1 Tax=Dactylosporangium sp. CA-139066 TaxID=3239930 RepID=UPI003D94FB3B